MPIVIKPKKGLIYCFLMLFTFAYAHVPYFGSKEIRNISVSQVHYYEVTNKDVTKIKIITDGENLYLMFAVPKIERLKDFRPRIKLIDPDDNVVEEFDTSSAEPRVYHEEFGDTYEWIYYEKEHKTIKGIYTLIVEYDKPGKFWIAVGRSEKFTLIDILSLPVTLTRVRLFHEEFPIVWWGWILITLLVLGILGMITFFQG